MTKYPDKGAEQYGDFRKTCDSFREAVESSDTGRIRETYDALRDGKKRCHSVYKK